MGFLQKVAATNQDPYEQAFEKLYERDNMNAYAHMCAVLYEAAHRDIVDIEKAGSDEEFLRTKETLEKFTKAMYPIIKMME